MQRSAGGRVGGGMSGWAGKWARGHVGGWEREMRTRGVSAGKRSTMRLATPGGGATRLRRDVVRGGDLVGLQPVAVPMKRDEAAGLVRDAQQVVRIGRERRVEGERRVAVVKVAQKQVVDDVERGAPRGVSRAVAEEARHVRARVGVGAVAVRVDRAVRGAVLQLSGARLRVRDGAQPGAVKGLHVPGGDRGFC